VIKAGIPKRKKGKSRYSFLAIGVKKTPITKKSIEKIKMSGKEFLKKPEIV
jgi:hypothetical protein|tara:strand:- start:12 stop:164 length:153 start_codon:yes stop_codon:yes gene_type:complete